MTDADDPVTAAELKESMQRLMDNAGSANGMGGGYAASWAGRTEYAWRQRLIDEQRRRGVRNFDELLADIESDDDYAAAVEESRQKIRGWSDEKLGEMFAEAVSETGQDVEFIGLMSDDIKRREQESDDCEDIVTDVAQQPDQSGEFNEAVGREAERRGWTE